MKTVVAPRYVGALVWLLSVCFLAAGAWVYRMADSGMARLFDEPGNPLPADEARPINAAFRVLQDLQRAGAQAAVPSGVAGPVIAPAPLPLPKAPAPGSAPDAGSKANLIFIQTGKRSVAFLDGQPLRAGQALASGDVVERVGKTYVLLRSVSGETKRIDMQNRFNPYPDPAMETPQ